MNSVPVAGRVLGMAKVKVCRQQRPCYRYQKPTTRRLAVIDAARRSYTMHTLFLALLAAC